MHVNLYVNPNNSAFKILKNIISKSFVLSTLEKLKIELMDDEAMKVVSSVEEKMKQKSNRKERGKR